MAVYFIQTYGIQKINFCMFKNEREKNTEKKLILGYGTVNAF
jgi:hypothetical protein